MSHTITAEFKLNEKNLKYFEKSVMEAGGKCLGTGQHKLYAGTVTGDGFLLPGWKYPIIVTPDGNLKYDNYGGNWGKQETLDRLIQRTVQKSLLAAARKAGFRRKTVAFDEDGRMVIRIQQY